MKMRQRFVGGFMVIGKALGAATMAALAASLAAPGLARADEGGAAFWVPGSFGSMAAVPGTPGWSVSAWFYTAYTSSNATDAFIGSSYGTIPANVWAVPYAKQYNATPSGYLVPTYTFKDPVLGGQLSLASTFQVTQSVSSIGGKWTGIANTPTGPQPYAAYGNYGDSISGLGDIAPDATLKWAFGGVHNIIAYTTFNIPAGQFSASRLANIGIGHWAVDAGAGYTYFDQKAGWEFSGVLGFTYNFINPQTQYQDGVDMHFDWAASYTFNDKISAGLVGYAFKEIGCDSGAGDTVGCNESRVFGIGPQVTYNFPVDDWQGSLNLKAYKEFWAENRPDGYNVWLTLSISPPAPPT